jgi:hypothetical protein
MTENRSMNRSINRLPITVGTLVTVIVGTVLIWVLLSGHVGDDSEHYATVDDLAAAIGCEGAPIVAEPQFFTESGFTCTVEYGDVNAYWFADSDALDEWEQVGLDAMAAWSGESEWPRLIGDQWAIEGSLSNLEHLADTLGGEVREH